jgi:drug/metabolite transporter, DME family
MRKHGNFQNYLAHGVFSPRNEERFPKVPRSLKIRTAYLLVISGLVLWGLSGIFTQNLLDAGMGNLEIAFYRLFLSSILFVLHALKQGDLHLKATRDFWSFAGFAVFAVVLNYLSFNYAISYGGVSLVNVLLATVPAFIALPAWLFFRERLTLRLVTLLILSIVGLLLAARGSSEGIHISLASLGFGALCVLSYAVFTLASKPLLNRYTPVAMNAFVMLFATLALLPVLLFSSGSSPLTLFTDKPFHVWVNLFLLVLLPSYLAYLFYHAGLKRLPASRVALLTNLDPVTGLLLAAIFFGERFTALGGFGVVLVLAVSVLAVLPDKPRRMPTPKNQPIPKPTYEPALQMMVLETPKS